MFKCGEAPFQGERACENPVRLSVYDGLKETVKYRCEYLVNARLDC